MYGPSISFDPPRPRTTVVAVCAGWSWWPSTILPRPAWRPHHSPIVSYVRFRSSSGAVSSHSPRVSMTMYFIAFLLVLNGVGSAGTTNDEGRIGHAFSPTTVAGGSAAHACRPRLVSRAASALVALSRCCRLPSPAHRWRWSHPDRRSKLALPRSGAVARLAVRVLAALPPQDEGGRARRDRDQALLDPTDSAIPSERVRPGSHSDGQAQDSGLR